MAKSNIAKYIKLPVAIGVICLLLGFVLNESLFEQYLSIDGNITSKTTIFGILSIQLSLCIVGVLLIVKQPLFVEGFVSKYGSNLLLILISIIFTLIIAEFALRQLFPPNPVNSAQVLKAHSILGWSKKPDSSFINILPQDNASIHVRYNSKGWRDVERSVEKPDGVFRILVLGDSFMEGTAVKLEDIFSQQLENLARDTGYNVEVINMAVGAYGTLQEYLAYQFFGQTYSPDLVLLGFFAMNDVQNNGFELHKKIGDTKSVRPFLDLHQVDEWHIVPVDYTLSQMQVASSKKRNEERNVKMNKQSAIIRLLSTALRKQKRLNDVSLLQWLGVSYCNEPKEYTSAWTATERILTKLKTDTALNNSQLVVFNVPALVEVDQDFMQATTSRTDHPERLCLEQAAHTTRLNLILEHLKIPQIDLLTDFRHATREQRMKLYMQSDRHWSPAGHALAAKRVFSTLVEQEILPKKYTAKTQLLNN